MFPAAPVPALDRPGRAPPTVAQGPRIPAVLLAVVVVMPLVAPWVPAGSVKSTVPPTFRMIAPSAATVPPALLALTRTPDDPGLTVMPAKVCDVLYVAAVTVTVVAVLAAVVAALSTKLLLSAATLTM